MSSDLKRIRTFLAYKGFQWEPLPDDRQSDFIAVREGKAAFCGTLISIGKERPCLDRPITIVSDIGEKVRLREDLLRQLKQCLRRLDRSAATSGLPKVVTVVNHDPRRRFDDLTAIVEGPKTAEPLSVDLFIWFDDFQSDRILFRSGIPLFEGAKWRPKRHES